MASTLSDEETEIVRSSIPEKSNKIAATAVIRLYTAFPDFEDWIYTGLEGAIVLLYDLSPPYGIWLRIVDISVRILTKAHCLITVECIPN